MAKITQQVDAKDYGDATQEAQDADALAATAAMEAETTPQLAPPAEESTEGQPAPEQEAPAASAAGVPQQQGFVPTNLMQRVPHRYGALPASSLADAVNSAAQMWGALATDPNASTGLRNFAQWMMED